MAFKPILQAALKYKPRIFLLGTCGIWYTVGRMKLPTKQHLRKIHHTGIHSVTALSKIKTIGMAAHNISEFQSTQVMIRSK